MSDVELSQKESAPLDVEVSDGQVIIKIGVKCLAWAIQCAEYGWPADTYICDIDQFAKDFADELGRESEDGTTPIHRLFDKVAIETMEQGSIGCDDGPVQKGLDLADG